MSKNLYITSLEPRSGKSVVALGIMELLSRRLHNIGFFRPIVSDGSSDNNLRLMLKRYDLKLTPAEMYAYKYSDARSWIADGRHQVLLKNILARYKTMENRCDFVLCEGSDYIGVASAFEFEFNAAVAANLSAPVLVVVNGRDKSAEEVNDAVRAAHDSFITAGCTILALVANRVNPEQIDTIRSRFKEESDMMVPLYILPEVALLGKPTVGEISKALRSRIIQGDSQGLNRLVQDIKVAAMNLPRFLAYVNEGTLIITPADRCDVILGCLAASASETYPNISGLLLSAGDALDPPMQRLVEGLRDISSFPVFSVKTDTYTTAMQATAVRSALTPQSDRKIAAALGLFESHVDLDEIENRIKVAQSTRMTPIMFEYTLIERARADCRRIVLPEGHDERILRAAEILLQRKVATITLLGNLPEIERKIAKLGIDLTDAQIIDPLQSPWLDEYVQRYYQIRRHKGISQKMARDIITSVNFFGTMMVHAGVVDGMVSGAAHTTAETIRPAFQIIGTRPGYSIVSSVFLMCLPDRVLIYGDCAVNPDPDAEALADIAISSAETALMYGIEPRVAMCSYATGWSGKGADVDKVRQATRLAKERRPDLKIEGPIQYDAAVDAGVAKTKLPDSEVAGRATVFIFPDLNTGNNLYKAVQRSSGAVAIGPVLQGLNKPVNDLSRGCTVVDIVNTVAITAIQAQHTMEKS